jgi:dihydroorotate dehydrogenase
MHATNTIRWGYERVLKPYFFKQDPEAVHDRMLAVGERLGRLGATRWFTRWLFAYRHPALAQTIAGLHFANPVGLPGGFDKNARLWQILPAVGFGFVEFGSITARASAGNAKPRLGRWPEGKSLVVNYGLPNEGAAAIAERLPAKSLTVPVGLNIAVTNTQEILTIGDAIRDYLQSLGALRERGDYFTINISCPNRLSDRLFIDPANLSTLLTEVDRLKLRQPIFLKLSPDMSESELEGVVQVVERHRVAGFISTNLTKNRLRLPGSEHLPKGGLSGKAVEDLADKTIRWLYRRTGKRHIIIGGGGVFSAEDAYHKIKLGASLVQVLTGMIYGGPQKIGEINRGLVKLLKKDGFKSISEAIGLEA